MKTRLFLLVSLLTCLSGNAQDRIGIAFIPITYDEASVSSSDAKMIQESVINSFVTAKKFTVVDREKLEALENEKSYKEQNLSLIVNRVYKMELAKELVI